MSSWPVSRRTTRTSTSSECSISASPFLSCVPVQPTPPQLVAIVMRMLEKNPQARPLSMRAVIEEFDATLNDTLHFEFDAEPQPQTPRREPPRREPAEAAPPAAPPAAALPRSRRAPPPVAKVKPAASLRPSPGPPPRAGSANDQRALDPTTDLRRTSARHSYVAPPRARARATARRPSRLTPCIPQRRKR